MILVNLTPLTPNRYKVMGERESHTIIGKGNIGTTSSAELLSKWREVLINIDRLIIDECKDLFMLIY